MWYILNFSFIWLLSNVAFAIIPGHERHRDVLYIMHSPLVAFYLTFRSFWLWLIVFIAMICLNDVCLRKAMTGVALNIYWYLIYINILKWLLVIFLIFGKVQLYVTENRIMFFRTPLVLFNLYLSELIVYFCDLISNNFFQQIV